VRLDDPRTFRKSSREKKILCLPGKEPEVLCCPVRSLVSKENVLPRLVFYGRSCLEVERHKKSPTLANKIGQYLFENRVLRKMVVPKKDELAGEWKILRNQKFFDLYSSRNIIRIIKSRSIRREGHVTHRRQRGTCRILVG